jgi:hypothetical protein
MPTGSSLRVMMAAASAGVPAIDSAHADQKNQPSAFGAA